MWPMNRAGRIDATPRGVLERNPPGPSDEVPEKKKRFCNFKTPLLTLRFLQIPQEPRGVQNLRPPQRDV